MSGKAELPHEWAKLAEQAGIRQSMSGIAERADVPTSTVSRLIKERRTSSKTVRLVAEALNVTPSRIWEIAGLPASALGPWDPPEEAHQLDAGMRAALDELIRAAARSAKGGSDAGQAEAQKMTYRRPRGLPPDSGNFST